MQTNLNASTRIFFNQLEQYCNNCPELFEHFVQDNKSEFYLKLNHNKFSQDELLKLIHSIKSSINFYGKNDNFNLSENFFSDKQKIPSEYTIFAGTLGTVAASIFKYIFNKFNKETMDTALDFMDVTLVDLKKTKAVNVVFMMKILRYCSNNLGMDKINFKELSLYIYLNTNRFELLKQAHGLTNDLQTLQFISENSNKYETNFKYTVGNIQNQKYQFIATANQEIHDGLGLKKLNNSEMLYLKKLIIENTPLLLGRKPMNVTHIQTTHKNGIEQTHFTLVENNYADNNNFFS